MQNRIISYNKSNPYYIVTPHYTDQSAGIKILHFLCHHLNLRGFNAFIVNTREYGVPKYEVNPYLNTPILSKELALFHQKSNLKPIVIYPDIVKENFLDSKIVVRYLLHYAGFFYGQTEFCPEDVIFSYSKKIATKGGFGEDKILFMPISNPEIFYPPRPSDEIKRKGTCFYASKYQSVHNGKLLPITDNSFEITRFQRDSLKTDQVADLFRRSECFYAYEDTSLITEAILCNCPVVLVKNEFFDGDILAKYELGSEGCVFSDDPVSLDGARSGLKKAQDKFFESIETFYSQFNNFIIETQKISNQSNSNVIKIEKIMPFSREFRRQPIGRILKNKIKYFLKYDRKN